MNPVIFVIIIFITLAVGAFGHEKDLIRHCVEENTLHTWSNEYVFECKAIYKQEIE